MVTNLMAAHSISFAASYGFVSGADGIGDTKGKSCDGKRRASREAIEFQIRVMAPTVLILEEKLAKGVWEMRGWTAREHRGGRDGRPYPGAVQHNALERGAFLR